MKKGEGEGEGGIDDLPGDEDPTVRMLISVFAKKSKPGFHPKMPAYYKKLAQEFNESKLKIDSLAEGKFKEFIDKNMVAPAEFSSDDEAEKKAENNADLLLKDLNEQLETQARQIKEITAHADVRGKDLIETVTKYGEGATLTGDESIAAINEDIKLANRLLNEALIPDTQIKAQELVKKLKVQHTSLNELPHRLPILKATHEIEDLLNSPDSLLEAVQERSNELEADILADPHTRNMKFEIYKNWIMNTETIDADKKEIEQLLIDKMDKDEFNPQPLKTKISHLLKKIDFKLGRLTRMQDVYEEGTNERREIMTLIETLTEKRQTVDHYSKLDLAETKEEWCRLKNEGILAKNDKVEMFRGDECAFTILKGKGEEFRNFINTHPLAAPTSYDPTIDLTGEAINEVYAASDGDAKTIAQDWHCHQLANCVKKLDSNVLLRRTPLRAPKLAALVKSLEPLGIDNPQDKPEETLKLIKEAIKTNYEKKLGKVEALNLPRRKRKNLKKMTDQAYEKMAMNFMMKNELAPSDWKREEQEIGFKQLCKLDPSYKDAHQEFLESCQETFAKPVDAPSISDPSKEVDPDKTIQDQITADDITWHKAALQPNEEKSLSSKHDNEPQYFARIKIPGENAPPNEDSGMKFYFSLSSDGKTRKLTKINVDQVNFNDLKRDSPQGRLLEAKLRQILKDPGGPLVYKGPKAEEMEKWVNAIADTDPGFKAMLNSGPDQSESTIEAEPRSLEPDVTPPTSTSKTPDNSMILDDDLALALAEAEADKDDLSPVASVTEDRDEITTKPEGLEEATKPPQQKPSVFSGSGIDAVKLLGTVVKASMKAPEVLAKLVAAVVSPRP